MNGEQQLMVAALRAKEILPQLQAERDRIARDLAHRDFVIKTLHLIIEAGDAHAIYLRATTANANRIIEEAAQSLNR